MKYLKYHKEYRLENLKSDFESSEMIKEVFENDITWGGSLLGRLINSAIRVFKIGFNYARIDSIIKGVKNELESLLEDIANKKSAENKKRIDDIKVRMVLAEIYKVVISDDDVFTKLKKLIGDEPLVDNTISIVEKSEIPNKSELLEKLKKFKEELMKLAKEVEVDKGDDEKEGEDEEEMEEDGKESGKNPVAIFYNNSKSLLSSVVKIHYDIKNNTVKFQQGKTGSGEKTGTFFDDKKYQQQRANTSDEINKKIALAKQAISVYTSKNNKERINFYNSEVKKYENKLKSLLSKTQQSTTTGQLKPAYDVEADKRAKELSKQMQQGKPVNASYTYLTEEIDANLTDQESHAKASWNKVVNAYNKSGISKYITYIESLLNPNGIENIKESKKKILEIGRQVVINYSNVGSPISHDELIKEKAAVPSVMEVAKSISLFGRVLLAFSDDMGLLGSYGASYKAGGEDAGGAGNHIKIFVKSFNQIKNTYASLKKESILMNYSSFILIKEAEDTEEEADNKSLDDGENDDTPDEGGTNSEIAEVDKSDKVKRAWFMFFKSGEEKEWKVTSEDTKFRDEFEKEMEGDKEIILENASNDDHIIKIVNLFGRAYKLYATDWIPSGRPGGRVSQRTLREYEYIGKGEPTIGPGSADSVIPSYGPWAAKLPYNKWQDGITKILEDKQLRRILANTKFVSEAESTTDTAIKAPGSGKTLFNFINDMLNNDTGAFKKHRAEMFKKYFGVEDKSISKSSELEVKGEKVMEKTISDDDKGDTDKPYFSNRTSLFTVTADIRDKSKNLLKVVTKDNSVFLIYPIEVDRKLAVDDKGKQIPVTLFKYQASKTSSPRQSIATNYLKDEKNKKGELYKMDLLEDTNNDGIPYNRDSKVAVGFANLTNNPFKEGKKFEFKYFSSDDVKGKNYGDPKTYTMEVKDIYYLIVPTEGESRGKQKQSLKLVKVQDADVMDNDVKVNVKEIVSKFLSIK